MSQTQPLWQLEIVASSEAATELAEQLGFLDFDGMEAVAISLHLDREQPVVEALFDDENAAVSAQSQFGGELCRVPDKDWVSLTQKGLHAVEAGPFLVHGAHEDGAMIERATYPICLEAGMAFGTGHHGTTKGCLLLLARLDEQGLRPERILDLGTGSGVLAIAAAKLWNRHVLASDIDADAVAVARDNSASNEVPDHIDVILADGLQDERLQGPFDLIIANILAGPLRGMAADIAQALAAEGRVILSGILDEQADWVQTAFEAVGLMRNESLSEQGWTSLLMQKGPTRSA